MASVMWTPRSVIVSLQGYNVLHFKLFLNLQTTNNFSYIPFHIFLVFVCSQFLFLFFSIFISLLFLLHNVLCFRFRLFSFFFFLFFFPFLPMFFVFFAFPPSLLLFFFFLLSFFLFSFFLFSFFLLRLPFFHFFFF